MKKRHLTAAFLFLSAFQAQAEYVVGDWMTAGDNSAFVDTSTGIEWLRLNVTLGQTMNEVLSQTGEGNLYDGWRVAGAADVQNILDGIMPTVTFNGVGETTQLVDSRYRTNTDDWRVVFGIGDYIYQNTSSGNRQDWYSLGKFMQDDGTVTVTGTHRVQHYTNGNTYHYAALYDEHGLGTGEWTMDNTSIYSSVFLVSDGGNTLLTQNDHSLTAANPNSPFSDVSAPALLGALSLFGFAVRRRKS